MNLNKWFLETKKADFSGIASRFGIDQVTARILRNRDIISDRQINSFLNCRMEMLYAPDTMMNAGKAAAIIADAIKNDMKIRVIGDYDVDGVCSAYILLSSIKKCGGNADAAIPHRIRDGYGLNETLIDEADADGISMIVTCDNGIAAYDQIVHAVEKGIRVVVTDHHKVPFVIDGNGTCSEKIPPADAVVDPHQAGDEYPYKDICGAVVAWKVVQLLMETMAVTECGEWIQALTEEAALATVCDVMPLLDENRIIVKSGLQMIENDCHNIGIRALIWANGLEGRHITAYSAGFVLGPCINASGRLSTAETALALLCAESSDEADRIAGELVRLNSLRKNDTAQGTSLALEIIEKDRLADQDVIVVYLPECSESIAGIIAGRIREEYNHPAFVITKSENGLKGSGRSIDTFDMYAHMSRHPELFDKFGGHKAAAGFSMCPCNLERFRICINEDTGLSQDDFIQKTLIDAAMPIGYITEGLINEFERLEPFGAGNSKPVFAQRDVRVVNRRFIGKNREFGKYLVSTDCGNETSMIFFGDAAAFNDYLDSHDSVVSILYYPEVNEFNGRKSIQIIMTDYR